MKMSTGRVLVLVVAFVVACGDNPADIGQVDEPATANSARKQCNLLVQTMCAAVAKCLIQEGEILSSERSDFIAVCGDQFEDEAFCDDVTAVGASFQQCLADINREFCFDPEDPPSSCEGAVRS